MAGSFEIKLTDNSQQIISQFNHDLAAGLEKIGMMAEGYAAALTPVGTPASTGVAGYIGGTLRQSMTHLVIGTDVYVGSNVYYAPYVEYGTGIHASNGQGRQTPWVWQDKNGQWHKTSGMPPQHMLQKAIVNHMDEYKQVLSSSFTF